MIGSDELAEGIVSPMGLLSRVSKSRSRSGEGSALAEIVPKIREARDALVGKGEVVFLQKKIPGRGVGVFDLMGRTGDLLDEVRGLVEVGILETVGSGAEGGEAAKS